jgi:hypothetical protein
LMFSVFSVLFYTDGSTGYRKKNEVFYLYKTFESAGKEFSQLNSEGNLTASAWKNYAKNQSVRFPEDTSVLPANLTLPMPWPEVLHDFDKMKSLQWNKLWLDYAETRAFPASPGEQAYDAQKIFHQWIVLYVCLALTFVTLFFLIRTLRRSISADAQALTTASGKRIPYSDLQRIDLRKWETKGLAFIDYLGPSGSGRVRIDGLTYGGFKKDVHQPAEQLIQKIRSNFSGELIEYAKDPIETADSDTKPEPRP